MKNNKNKNDSENKVIEVRKELAIKKIRIED